MSPRYEGEGKSLTVDHDKCTGDGACVDVCPANVFELVEGKSTAPNIADCTECCACVSACPEDAIEHDSC